jgi:hypothetical protein
MRQDAHRYVWSLALKPVLDLMAFEGLASATQAFRGIDPAADAESHDQHPEDGDRPFVVLP